MLPTCKDGFYGPHRLNLSCLMVVGDFNAVLGAHERLAARCFLFGPLVTTSWDLLMTVLFFTFPRRETALRGLAVDILAAVLNPG